MIVEEMQSIAHILEAQKIGSKDLTADQSEATQEEQIESLVLCEFCGKPRQRLAYQLGDVKFVSSLLAPCDCPQGKAAYEREQADEKAKREAEERAKKERQHQEHIAYLTAASGIGARFMQRTFGTFKVDDRNRVAYNLAKEYADNFGSYLPNSGLHQNKNGLFIVGPPGTGKTHLAAAVANQIMGQGESVIFATMIDLLGNIKSMFKYEGGEMETLRKYKTVPLLVIDDMGKEPPTEWAVSTIYNIINGRYESMLPTVVTTNYGTNNFIARLTPRETKDSTTAEALIDRLREMCKGIALSGESRRGKQ